MKRKFLEELGLEKDVIDKIMAENGADIEAEKAKTIEANTKLEDATKQLEKANSTIKDLKKNNADNEALQTKVKRPEFISYDEGKRIGTYVRYPERSELNAEINESLIVEFYSRV